MKFSCKTNVFVTELGESLALLDMQTGTYYTINDTGAIIWKELTQGNDLSIAVDKICETYDISSTQANVDADSLVGDLLHKGIIFRVDDKIAD